MTDKTTNTILILTLIGIILGAVIGYYFPGVMLAISVIGVLFMRALQLLVVPLVVVGIIAGVASLGNVRKLGRPLVTTVIYFASTTALAVGLGLVLATLVQPGRGANIMGAVSPGEVAALKSTGIIDILLSLIPFSLPQAVIEGRYLGIIVASLFFAGVLVTLGRRGRIVVDFFKVVREVILKLVYIIIYAAPVGLFSLIGTTIAENSTSLDKLSGGLLYYSLTIGAGLLIHAIIVLPLALRFFGHRSPLRYFSNMAPALSTALATGSSAVAFPVVYTGVVDKNKVDSRAGSLVLPLGMTLNLNGTAMHVAIGALFISQAFGMNLSAVQIITIAAVSILISLGASSIPNIGILLLVIVMRIAGFPLEAYAGIGLIIIVDWFFDRFRAVVNVWGDAIGAAVVAAEFEPKAARGERIRPQLRKIIPSERKIRPPVTTRRSDRGQARTSQRPRRDDRDRKRTVTSSERSRNQVARNTRLGTRDRSARQRPEHKRESRQTVAPKSTIRPGGKEKAPFMPDDSRRATPVESGDIAPSREKIEHEKTPLAAHPVRLSGKTKPEPDRSLAKDDVVVNPSHDTPHTESRQETPPAQTLRTEYGRSKVRRRRLVKDDHSKTSQDESDKVNAQEEFPIENISFGRQRKKRHR